MKSAESYTTGIFIYVALSDLYTMVVWAESFECGSVE